MLSSEKKKLRAEIVAKGLKDPVVAFSNQRHSAERRGLEFTLTFDEWWDMWRDYYHLRGRGTNGLCMARLGDQGGYTPGNVYLTTNLGNLQDYRASALNSARRAKKYDASAKGRIWGKKGTSLFKATDIFGGWRDKPYEELDEEAEMPEN